MSVPLVSIGPDLNFVSVTTADLREGGSLGRFWDVTWVDPSCLTGAGVVVCVFSQKELESLREAERMLRAAGQVYRHGGVMLGGQTRRCRKPGSARRRGRQTGRRYEVFIF